MTEPRESPAAIAERDWTPSATPSFDTAKLRRRVGIGALIAGSIGAGVLLAATEPLWVVAVVAGVAVATLVANRPLWGLLFAMTVWFIRPGEMWGVPYAAKFAMGLVVGGYLIHKVLTKERWVRTPMTRWVALLLTGVLISFLGAYWVTAYQEMLSAFLIQLVSYILILNLCAKRRDFMVVLFGFLVLTAVVSVLGVREYAANAGDPMFRTSGVTGGLFESGNDFAQLLCMFLPVAIMLARAVKNLAAKFSLYGLALLFVSVLTMTGSRGGFVGLAFVTVLLAWYSRRRILSFMLLPVLAVAFFALSPGAFVERVSGITDYGDDESAQGRLDAWAAARRIFIARPFTGVGLGCFQYAAGDYGSGVERVAHNSFYQILAELGIVGITAFIGMIIYALLATHKAAMRLNTRGDPLGEAAARGLYIGVWGYVITAIFLTSCYYPDLYWFMALSGAIGAWSLMPEEQATTA